MWKAVLRMIQAMVAARAARPSTASLPTPLAYKPATPQAASGMDVAALQRRLVAKGHAVAVDGRLGPQTYAALFSYVAGRNLGDRGELLGRGAAIHLPAYGITTPLRLAHFLGQCAHESCGFFYMEELGGRSYCSKYDITGPKPALARKLGNTQPGDGYRYKGRGIIQLTGRFNYKKTGERLGMDLEGDPYKAAQPMTAVQIACDYWKSRNINALADRDDLNAVTRAINGGTNGLADRIKYTKRAKGMLL